MFQNNFIMKYKKLLDGKTCSDIIKISNSKKHPFIYQEPTTALGIDRSKKDCSQINLHFSHSDLISNRIGVPLQKSLGKYLSKNNSFDIFKSSPLLCDGYTLQKYNPGQGYHLMHCENSGTKFSNRRVLAWMIYLNDVTEGGQTYFPYQNKKIKPRAGDAYIWPAYFTHPHKGIVSKTQSKYIVTGWVVYSD